MLQIGTGVLELLFVKVCLYNILALIFFLVILYFVRDKKHDKDRSVKCPEFMTGLHSPQAHNYSNAL